MARKDKLLPQLLPHPTCPPWHPVSFPLWVFSTPHTAKEHVSHIGVLSRGETGILTGNWGKNGGIMEASGIGGFLAGGSWSCAGSQGLPLFRGGLEALALCHLSLLTSVLLWFQPPTLLGKRLGTQLPLLSYLAFFQLPVTQTPLPCWTGFPKLLITKLSFSLKQLYLA